MGLFDKKKKQEEPVSPEESQMRHQSAPQPTAMDEAMKILAAITIKAPVKIGDVVCKDICGTGVNVVATKNIAG